MSQIALAYREFPEIDAVSPLDDSDRECLNEIRAVLGRHGKLNRFGIRLLHNHFPIREDETLLETCYGETRTMVTKVVPSAGLSAEQAMETMWRLTDDASMVRCERTCARRMGTGHTYWHERLPDKK